MIIVDDRSKDGTTERALEVLKATKDVKSKIIKIKNSYEHYDSGSALKLGQKFLEADIGYVGVLDADMILPRNYYEELIDQFRKNRSLGIASGKITHRKTQPRGFTDTNIGGLDLIFDHYPYGGNRLYSIACWRKLVNYAFPCSIWDTYHNIVALNSGWDIKRFEELTAFSQRPTGSRRGFVKGYDRYIMGFPFYWAIYKGLLTRDFKMIAGYFKAYLLKEKIIVDNDLIRNQLFKTIHTRLG